MLIPCPYCGPRIHEEFSYLGDATLRRPDASAPAAEPAFVGYAYLRDNPAGVHRELWFHASGCHAWLVVERDLRTHVIAGASPAHGEDRRDVESPT
jgi:methylglutamate dehydrogenase subunit B